MSIVGAKGAKPEEHGSIRVYYDCPDCRHQWKTSYLAPDGPHGRLISSPVVLGVAGPGSEPMYPVDGCPNCVTGAAHPWQLSGEPTGDGIVAFYGCPRCGHEWQTSWAFDALGNNCPGCPVCARGAMTS